MTIPEVNKTSATENPKKPQKKTEFPQTGINTIFKGLTEEMAQKAGEDLLFLFKLYNKNDDNIIDASEYENFAKTSNKEALSKEQQGALQNEFETRGSLKILKNNTGNSLSTSYIKDDLSKLSDKYSKTQNNKEKLELLKQLEKYTGIKVLDKISGDPTDPQYGPQVNKAFALVQILAKTLIDTNLNEGYSDFNVESINNNFAKKNLDECISKYECVVYFYREKMKENQKGNNNEQNQNNNEQNSNIKNYERLLLEQADFDVEFIQFVDVKSGCCFFDYAQQINSDELYNDNKDNIIGYLKNQGVSDIPDDISVEDLKKMVKQQFMADYLEDKKVKSEVAMKNIYYLYTACKLSEDEIDRLNELEKEKNGLTGNDLIEYKALSGRMTAFNSIKSEISEKSLEDIYDKYKDNSKFTDELNKIRNGEVDDIYMYNDYDIDDIKRQLYRHKYGEHIAINFDFKITLGKMLGGKPITMKELAENWSKNKDKIKDPELLKSAEEAVALYKQGWEVINRINRINSNNLEIKETTTTKLYNACSENKPQEDINILIDALIGEFVKVYKTPDGNTITPGEAAAILGVAFSDDIYVVTKMTKYVEGKDEETARGDKDGENGKGSFINEYTSALPTRIHALAGGNDQMQKSALQNISSESEAAAYLPQFAPEQLAQIAGYGNEFLNGAIKDYIDSNPEISDELKAQIEENIAIAEQQAALAGSSAPNGYSSSGGYAPMLNSHSTVWYNLDQNDDNNNSNEYTTNPVLSTKPFTVPELKIKSKETFLNVIDFSQEKQAARLPDESNEDYFKRLMTLNPRVILHNTAAKNFIAGELSKISGSNALLNASLSNDALFHIAMELPRFGDYVANSSLYNQKQAEINGYKPDEEIV